MADLLDDMKKRRGTSSVLNEDGLPLSFEEWQQQEYGDVLASPYTPAEVELAPSEWDTGVEEDQNEFMKGLYRGVDQSQAMLYGAAMLLGKVTDSDSMKQWGLDGYVRNMEEAEKNAAAVASYEDIGSFGDAADWFIGSLGELAPSMAETVVAAVAGGGVGGLAARTLAKKAIKESVEKMVAKGIAKEVAETAVKRTIGKKVGSALGMHGFVWALESGGMFGEDVETRGMAEANPYSAAMFGAVASAAESVGASGQIVRNMLGEGAEKLAKEAVKTGNRSALKTIGLETLRTATGEAATEFGQEALGILNTRFNQENGFDTLPTDEEWSQMLNAAAKGFVGGGTVGPISSLIKQKNKGAADKEPTVSHSDAIKEIDGAIALTAEQIDNAIISADTQAEEVGRQKQEELTTGRKKAERASEAETRKVGRISTNLIKEAEKNGFVPPTPDLSNTKTVVMGDLRAKKNTLEKDLEMANQRAVFSTPVNEEEATQRIKERNLIKQQLQEVTNILDIAEEYGHLVPEEEGKRLLSLTPSKMLKNKSRTMEAAQEKLAKTQEEAAAKKIEVAQKASREAGLLEAQETQREFKKELEAAEQQADLDSTLARMDVLSATQDVAEEAAKARQVDVLAAESTVRAAPEKTPTQAPVVISPEAEPVGPSRLVDAAGMPIESPSRPAPSISEVTDVRVPIEEEKAPSGLVGPTGKPLLNSMGEKSLEARRPKKKLPVKGKPAIKEQPKPLIASPTIEMKDKAPKEIKKPSMPTPRPKTTPKPSKILKTKAGKPFKTEASARKAISNMGRGKAFEYRAIEIDGGWGVRKKTRLEKQLGPRFKRTNETDTSTVKFEHTRGNTHFLQDKDGMDLARVEFETTDDGVIIRDIEVEEQGKGYGQLAIDKLLDTYENVYTGRAGDKLSTDATYMLKRLIKDPNYKVYSLPDTKAGLGTKGKRTTTPAFSPKEHFAIRRAVPKFKRPGKAEAEASKRNVNKLLKEVVRGFRAVEEGRVKMKVLEDPLLLLDGTEAEKALYNELVDMNALDALAVYDEADTIYLFSNRLDGNSQKIVNTITHELRHFSMQEILGKDMKNLLEAYVREHRDNLSERLESYGMEVNEENLLVEAEEDIVDSFITGGNPTWVEKFKALLAKWARRVFKGLKVSEAEIATLVETLDKQYKSGKKFKEGTAPVKTKLKRSAEFNKAKNLVGHKANALNTVEGFKKFMSNPNWTSIYRQLFDHTIDIKNKLGNTLHTKRRLLASSESMAEFFLVQGKPVWDKATSWVKIGDATKQDGPLTALRSLGEYQDVFMMWMQSESIKEVRDTRGLDTTDFYGSPEGDAAVHAAIDREAAAAKKEVGQAKWDSVVKTFQDFTKAKLDIAKQAGLVDEELAKDWERSMYIPLYREIDSEMADDLANLDPAAWRKQVKDHIETLQSGEKKGALSDPLEAYVHNFKAMMNESLRNQVWKENIATMLSMDLATPVKKFKADQQILGVMAGGKVKYFQIHDPHLFEALQELPPVIRGALGTFFNKPKKFFTKWITKSPAFMMRNFIRDTLHSWILMGDDVGFGKAWSDAWKGMLAVYRQHPDFIELMSKGGAFAEYDATGRVAAKNILNKSRSRISNSALYSWWTKIGVAAENANRVAMYRRMKQAGKSDLEAAYQAKDVMDFSATGRAGILRGAMMVLPFFNARLQGLGKIGREVTARDKAAMMMRGSILSLAALALGMLNDDREEWENMQDYEKFSAMHTWIGDWHVKIPLPFELSILYTAPMASLEVLKSNRESGFLWDLTKSYLSDTLAFNPTPQTLKPLWEDATNRDMFRDRAIVGRWEKEIDPTLQFSPWTSPTVIGIAKAIDELSGGIAPEALRSPKRLQHLLDGYFSTAAKLAYGSTDAIGEVLGINAPRTAKDFQQRLLNLTGLNKLYTEEINRTTYKEQKVYEAMEDVMEVANTYAELKARRQIGQARGYLQSHKKDIRLAKYYRGWQQKLKSISTQGRIIERSKKLTSEQKYQKQQKLQIERSRIFMKIYDRMVKEGVFAPKGD